MAAPGNTPSGRSSRGWAAFSLIGIGLWVGITVLVTLLHDDPADGRSTLIAFVSGGAVFFALVFGAALVGQLRWRAQTGEIEADEGGAAVRQLRIDLVAPPARVAKFERVAVAWRQDGQKPSEQLGVGRKARR